MHRQKVTEVEKLSTSVRQLEEALLSGAAAANTVRDYQRQLSKIKEEKKMLERTLSRAKVKENRAAVVVANEWKEADDKMIPIKQWLEERRVLLVHPLDLRHHESPLPSLIGGLVHSGGNAAAPGKVISLRESNKNRSPAQGG